MEYFGLLEISRRLARMLPHTQRQSLQFTLHNPEPLRERGNLADDLTIIRGVQAPFTHVPR